MPITGPKLPRLTEDEMRALDYAVMAHAFAAHRSLRPPVFFPMFPGFEPPFAIKYMALFTNTRWSSHVQPAGAGL